MIKLFGITGGVGSGKSTLVKSLLKKGYLVHDSDKIVSHMYKKPKKTFIKFLEQNISKNILKNNKINKKLITNTIFNNLEIKKKLEKHIHKEVQISRKKFIKKNKRNKKGVLFAEVPLLFENTLEKEFDLVICVISSKKNRSERNQKNKKFTKEIFNKIIKMQVSDKERRERSNIIIHNNNSKSKFLAAADKALLGVL